MSSIRIPVVDKGSNNHKEEKHLAKTFEKTILLIKKTERGYTFEFNTSFTGKELTQEGFNKSKKLLNNFRQNIWEERQAPVEVRLNRTECWIKGLKRKEARTIAHVFHKEVLEEEGYLQEPTRITKFL